MLDDEKGFVEGFEEIGKDDFGKRIVGQRRKLKVELKFLSDSKSAKMHILHF